MGYSTPSITVPPTIGLLSDPFPPNTPVANKMPKVRAAKARRPSRAARIGLHPHFFFFFPAEPSADPLYRSDLL